MNQLVDILKYNGAIYSNEAIEIMKSVDRAKFVPQHLEKCAYLDRPLPIGFGQTISAPSIHSLALEVLLEVIPDPLGVYNILDVGCGSGYFSALLAKARPNANVYGIDCFDGLLKQTNDHCDAVAVDVQIIHADGWKGLPQVAPFDIIHCGAGATTIPSPLLAQLKLGGRMIIPVGPTGMQTYLQVDRIQNDDAKANAWNGDGLSTPQPDTQAYSPSNLHSGHNGGSDIRDVDLSKFVINELSLVAFVPLIPDPKMTTRSTTTTNNNNNINGSEF
jgi:protein-L-isoaspartate(D-aspartate) O-methyltransferase